MLFWIVAALLALAICGLLLLALLRARGQATSAAEYDVAIYRDQLQEVERDLARGTVTDDEAERVRTEVSRRLLDADRNTKTGADPRPAPRTLSIAAALVISVVTIGGALALYSRLGAPGYPDLPLAARIAMADTARANRPDQATAESGMAASQPAPRAADPKFVELMAKLRSTVIERPGDLQGQMLLARNEAALGNFAAAQAAQTQVIAIKGDAATATDYADLVDLMALAAGGYISPEAETAIRHALEKDARNGPARYYLGLMYAQTGRPDLSFQIWRALLAESTDAAPWVPPIRAQIEDVANLAGVRFSLPAAAGSPAPGVNAAPGPSAADMAAAAEMSDEDRNEMIRNMVAGLDERLSSEGGSPEEWARLINALGVLGETERATKAWDQAQAAHGAHPPALSIIRNAARNAGVAE